MKLQPRALTLCLLAVLTTGTPVSAQAVGRIVGRVYDVTSGRPINGAQVYLSDATLGTLSDLDGRFVLTGVPVGTHSVVAQMLGYVTKTITGVEITGGVAALDVGLEVTAVEIEGITVSAELERGNNVVLLDQRRTANALVEAVGAVDISRRPDSDAADVAKRMTGVTVSEGKYVFVRGLGERYSQTTLNGSSLPSPEPDKEVVPLDLFPTGFLESLETQKSYTPDLPADFSGGSVRINTKDFPSDLQVRLGVGTSFNTESAFKDTFLRVPGSGTGFFGTDDGSRDFPAEVLRVIGGVRGQPLPNDPQTRVSVGEALRSRGQAFEPATGSTPTNRSFDLSIGGSQDVLRSGEIGYFLAGTYSDSYVVRDKELERKYFTTAFEPTTPDELRLANVDYDFLRGTRNISWGTIGNVTFKPAPTQKISLRTTVNLNSEEEARVLQGLNSEDIGGQIRTTRVRFIERLLTWGQLSGEHQTVLDSRLDWRLTAARASRDEPFLREAIYLEDDDDFKLLSGDASGRLFWSQLADDDVSGEFDWRFPFTWAGQGGSVKFGGAYRHRMRDSGARRFRYDFFGSLYTDLDAALDTATIVESVRRAGQFSIDERGEPGDLYDVEDTRRAAYVMVELPLSSRLQSIFGARLETYDLRMVTQIAGAESVLADRNETDLAPGLSLIYSVSDDLKLRAGASRTTDRPEFRELAPFQFTETTSLRQIIGNPELVAADIVSADLRADWFPGPGELLSLGGFYKKLDRPIELVYLGAASTAYQYANAVEATLLGLEVDANVAFRRLAEALESLFLQANFSWIDSEVAVERVGAFNPTNRERPLVGQAPYVLNTGVTWLSPGGGWEAGLYFNRFGERLEAASGEGIPDIYEQPRNALDATLAFGLPGNARVKLKGSNLLNAPYRFEQSANGVTLVQQEYEVGSTISVGLSWELR